jgi:hypothetical protein
MPRRKNPFFGGGRDPFAETTKINSRKKGQGGRGQGRREHLITDFGDFGGFRAEGSAGGGTGGAGLSELIRGNRA